MSAALVLPSEPTSLVAVHQQCDAVDAWAEQCDSVPAIKDNHNALAAWDLYLTRTSTEGRARVAATMRRLEVRLGGLLGPPRREGRQYRVTPEEAQVSDSRRSEFRSMAEHADLVEDVIAESTDQHPATRKRVLSEIKETKVTGAVRTRSALAEREAKVRDMAAAGYSTSQIAEAVGLSESGTRSFCKLRDITIPADIAVGRSRRLDSNRIVEGTVSSAGISDELLAAIDYPALDRDSLEHWVSSLSVSIRSLTTLKNKLRKELTND